MQRWLILLGLVGALALSAACSTSPASPTPARLETSNPSAPETQPQATTPAESGASTPRATATRPPAGPPVSECQTRLWGNLTDAKGSPAPNLKLTLKGGASDHITISDAGGLYGFAGLCAGDYTVSVVLANDSTQDLPEKIKLDGSASVKQDLNLK